MNTYPSAPLSPEERELAQLTARLGPHGEPSPALDARILAAAHAAVDRRSARKPKPRWPVAMGLAASVVFAVGIAWQLRPVQQAATIAEAPEAYSRMEQPLPEVAAESVAAPGQAADAAAEAPPADDASAMAAAAPSPAADITVSAPVVATAEPAPRAQRPRPAARPAAPEAPAVMRQSHPSDSYARGAAASAPPPPPAPPAAAASIPAKESTPSFVSDPEADAVAQEQYAAGIQGYNASTATAKQITAHSERKANAATRGRENEKESGTLDRVEVTGARISRTDLQVPVSNDAQLAVEEWLERVRTRYGLGDAGAAKQSLLLFVKDHPGEPIPDDLEPLLEE